MLRKVIRKIKSFVSIPWATKCLFAEAIITSAYVKAILLFFPFRQVANRLGALHTQSTDEILTQEQGIVKEVKFAIKLCDRYTPWPTECYTRSLTAKIMLKRRKLASILYFGFRKDDSGTLTGHSWLKCSGMIVTGFCDFSQYQVHSSFS
jgi:hypothetical protein